MTDAQITRFWRYLRVGMTVAEARHQAVVTDEARANGYDPTFPKEADPCSSPTPRP